LFDWVGKLILVFQTRPAACYCWKFSRKTLNWFGFTVFGVRLDWCWSIDQVFGEISGWISLIWRCVALVDSIRNYWHSRCDRPRGSVENLYEKHENS
jgi:hypothetical protein